jgi:hypothetical protein
MADKYRKRRRVRKEKNIKSRVSFIGIGLVIIILVVGGYYVNQAMEELEIDLFNQKIVEEEVDPNTILTPSATAVKKLETLVSGYIVRGDVVPMGGGLYDKKRQKWMLTEDILENVSIDVNFHLFDNLTFFYTDRLLMGHVEDGQFNVYDKNDFFSKHSTLLDAQFVYHKGFGAKFQEGALLKRGHEDRAAIAEVIKSYEQAERLVYVRYLKATNNAAYLIASPGADTQLVEQYYLRKIGEQWEVILKGEKDSGYGLLNKNEINDFPLSLLPEYQVSNHYIPYYTQQQQTDFVGLLVEAGVLEQPERIAFMGRVDNYVLILFDSGTRALVKVKAGVSLQYESHTVLGSNTDYSQYHSLIDQDYLGKTPPYFLFIMN